MNEKIVMIGDSITAGFDEKKLLPDFKVINKGINGDSSLGVLKRLQEDVIELKPKIIFILIGTNDLAFGRTDDEIVKTLREILSMLKKSSDKHVVYVQSILPTRNVSDRPNDGIISINSQLKILAEKFGFIYLDLHSEMKDENGNLKKNFTDDGLHLSRDAYETWSGILKNILINN
jgi:lysophospholipase L1-like esterase